MAGYFEEEAFISYIHYLAQIEAGEVENTPAAPIATEYWNLGQDARLRDVVTLVRAYEVGHRNVNHRFAAALPV